MSDNLITPSALDQIRSVLLDKSLLDVDDIKQALNDDKRFEERVGQVLPSILNPIDRNNKKLAFQLQGSLIDSLNIAGQTQPKRLAASLAPAIGPAITSAITQALAEFRSTLDAAMQNYLSPRGLMWRFQSWRTGESFSRIAQRNTQSFGLDSVILVHKGAQDIVYEKHQNADIALLAEKNALHLHPRWLKLAQPATITDSIHRIESTEVKLSDDTLQVLVAHGAWLSLICPSWGSVPDAAKQHMLSTLQSLHKDYAEELRNHKLGSDNLAGLGMSAQSLLLPLKNQSGLSTTAGKKTGGFSFWKLLGLLLLAGLAYLGWQRYQTHTEEIALRSALAAQPGVIVQSLEKQQGQWQVKALADPDGFAVAAFNKTLLANNPQLKPALFELQPYLSLQPDAILTRAKAQLQAPAGLSLTVGKDRVLAVSGNADSSHSAWLAQLPQLWQRVAGLTGFSVADVKTVAVAKPALNLPMVETQVLEIEKGTVLSEAGESQLQGLVVRIQQFSQLAQDNKARFGIRLTGLNSDTGDSSTNSKLRLARADAVQARLVASGLAANQIEVVDTPDGPSVKGVAISLRLEALNP
jgi:hypothetical protein